jgi:transposase
VDEDVIEKWAPESLWEIVAPLIPPAPRRPQGGGRRRVDDRRVLAAILYLTQGRCCIKRSSRSPTAKLPVRSNSAAQLGLYDRDKSGPLAGSVRRRMAVLQPVFSLVVENLRRRDRAMA